MKFFHPFENQKPQIEVLELSMSYDNSREKSNVFFSHHVLFCLETLLYIVQIRLSRSSKSLELSTIVVFLSIIDCISCISTLKLCPSFRKEFQLIEIKKFAFRTETESLPFRTNLIALKGTKINSTFFKKEKLDSKTTEESFIFLNLVTL